MTPSSFILSSSFPDIISSSCSDLIETLGLAGSAVMDTFGLGGSDLMDPLGLADSDLIDRVGLTGNPFALPFRNGVDDLECPELVVSSFTGMKFVGDTRS